MPAAATVPAVLLSVVVEAPVSPATAAALLAWRMEAPIPSGTGAALLLGTAQAVVPVPVAVRPQVRLARPRNATREMLAGKAPGPLDSRALPIDV